jgi:hypothetical protein
MPSLRITPLLPYPKYNANKVFPNYQVARASQAAEKVLFVIPSKRGIWSLFSLRRLVFVALASRRRFKNHTPAGKKPVPRKPKYAHSVFGEPHIVKSSPAASSSFSTFPGLACLVPFISARKARTCDGNLHQ